MLRRTKRDVLAAERHRGRVENVAPFLLAAAGGHGFYNTSRLDFPALLADPGNVAANLRAYIVGFSGARRR